MKQNVKQYQIDTAKAIESLADMMLSDLELILSKKKEKKLVPVECHRGSYHRS